MRIRYRRPHLSYADTADIAKEAFGSRSGQTVLLDLSKTKDASTAALAVLVRLRFLLLVSGRDLKLSGLTDRTRALWQFCRLGRALPLA